MARKPRIHFPGALYHVIVRGNHKRKTFFHESDYERYLARIRFYKERYKFHLHAFALMPNHVHLLIKVSEIPLSKIMQGLQFSYTQYFNTKYNKAGHLFQGRYKAILCKEDKYLLSLIRYIHFNPLRSGLIKNFGDLAKYKWASLPDYLGSVQRNLVECDYVLSIFGGKRKQAMLNLANFLLEQSEAGHQDEFYMVKDQRLLGDEDFVEEALKRADQKGRYVYSIALSEIIDATCKYYGIRPHQLLTKTRDRELARYRGIIAYLNKELCGRTYKEVADYYKRASESVLQMVRKIEGVLKTERKLAKDVTKLVELCTEDRRTKPS